MLIPLLTLWKNWGFGSSIFGQAKYFLTVAQTSSDPGVREGYVRASIVFFLVAFEAYFFEVVRGYIQERRASIDPVALEEVEAGLQRTGLHEALRKWPRRLTGQPLDTTEQAYQDLLAFIKYRNALVHGKITEPIPTWGVLAQEVETSDNAEHVRRSVSTMTSRVAAHFG